MTSGGLRPLMEITRDDGKYVRIPMNFKYTTTTTTTTGMGT